MKRSKSSRILKILSYVLLITGMIVILYPFYLTIITALKTPQESSQSFFSFPQSFYLGNFVNVLQKANYFVFFRNSAVVTLVSVFLIMVLIPMCSYAIARNMEKRYYKTMYFYLLAGIFVPFQVIMVPLVKYLAKLKLCNIPGLIIMCVTLASSQGVFLLVNYIRSVPRDLCPCVVLGEMADNGMPLSCETDINGAITLAILRACNLFEESEFLADLTIRHPQNDNAELLWHCGPFPYSLKKDGVEAKLVDGQERFELKQGDLTVCRFDDVDGEYYLFAGEAKTTTGPETNGTYVWMETDNWKRWEEKLMFGPYIHHLGCVYGHYLPVLREVSRYLGIHFDNAHEQGIYSL